MRASLITRLKEIFNPQSLLIQLLSRSLLILAVILLLVGSIQYFFMRDLIYQNKASSLENQFKSFPPPAWGISDYPKREDDEPPPHIFMPETSLVFIDLQADYKVISDGPENISPPQLSREEYKSKLKSSEKRRADYQLINAGGTEQLVVFKTVYSYPGKKVGLLQISTPTAHMKELLRHQMLGFLFLALLALMGGLLVYLPVIRRTLAPLSRMVDTAEQIDAGNLDRRFPIRQGQAEIDHLADSCNGMLERLETSFIAERETQEQMRRFIADASHELRTPLTSIHGFLEVLLRGAANQPDQLEKALKSMYSESQRLNKLVHDLLLLSKLDRSAAFEMKDDYLDDLLREMEAQLRILAGSRELDFQIEPALKCKYDGDKIKQVILNLFQNAVQHTDPDKGYIKISLKQEDNGIIFAVKDNGPGISQNHIPRIFDRFYRSDSSRTRKYGGAGLGLSISKSIVEAHGGRISISSQEGHGSTFAVWLPGVS